MDQDGANALVAVMAVIVVVQVVVRHHVAAQDARPSKRRRSGPRRYGQRMQWTYDELTDFEFARNYRMTKRQFAVLVTKISAARDKDGKLILTGVGKKSRSRQKAASGAPIGPEIQLSMTLRWLAGGSYLDIIRIHAARRELSKSVEFL